MYRERLDYADNYKMIENEYPNEKYLGIVQVARLLRISRQTAAKRFIYDKSRKVTIASLARQLSVL